MTSVLISLLLAACSVLWGTSRVAFEGSAEGEKYLLQVLQGKYGVRFVIVGEGKLTEYADVGWPAYFSATVAPAENLEWTAKAAVRATGEESDDYAKNYYKAEVEEPAKLVCKSKDYLESWSVEIYLPQRSDAWDETRSLPDFVKNSGVMNEVRVSLALESTRDEYATNILDLLDGLFATGMWFSLFVDIGGENIGGAGYNWTPASVNKPDREWLLESLQGAPVK